MSSTYSPILRTELIGAGDQAGTWGNTTNSNFQYIFESAIAGYVAVTVSPTANNQVLTYVNGPSASAALNQSVYAMLKLNAGSLGANFNIFCPPVSKVYVIWNNTSYTASFYNSTVIGNTTPAGSAAVIPAGAKVTIWSDGSSFYTSNDTTIGNFSVTGNVSVGGTLAVTGTSSFTGNATFAGTASFGVGPTAPTAAPGTSTNQLATTAFVQAATTALGLGTMATQNANAVAITGGTMTGMTTVAGGAHSGTTATFSGAVGGSVFNGAGTGLTGTAASLTAGLVTNGVYTTGSYADPSWITSLAGAKITGTVANATTAATVSTTVASGATGTTQTAGTNNTSIATTAFVTTAVNNATGSLGTMSTQNANNVNITGGTITGSYGLTAANATNAVNATNATNATTASNANAFQGKTKLGLGITGEIWRDVTGARAQGVTYYNTNGYPIQVSGNFGCNGGGQGQIYIDGVLVSFWQAQFNGCGGYSVNMPCIVPAGSSYVLASMGGGARGWYELY